MPIQLMRVPILKSKMKAYQLRILILSITALSACATSPETQRSYFGIAGPASILHLDDYDEISNIPGVSSLKDEKLLSNYVFTITFTPQTDQCRKTWLGQKICETDKRPVEETDAYKAIIEKLDVYCGTAMETHVKSDSLFGNLPYRLITKCPNPDIQI